MKRAGALKRVVRREPVRRTDEPEPAREAAAGDKTPEWAAWLKRTDPEAYERRFAGRKLQRED